MSVAGSTSQAARFIVHGRVQGVGFRYSTVRSAERLGLYGWVRNNPDGTVELLAEGNRESLEKLAGWLARGPVGAHVVRVDRVELPYTGTYRHFLVDY